MSASQRFIARGRRACRGRRPGSPTQSRSASAWSPFRRLRSSPLAAFEVADPSLGACSAAQQPRQSGQRRRLSSASTMRRFAPRSRCRQRLTLPSWICRCRPVCPQRPHTRRRRLSPTVTITPFESKLPDPRLGRARPAHHPPDQRHPLHRARPPTPQTSALPRPRTNHPRGGDSRLD